MTTTGLDWSGTPDAPETEEPKQELYVACAVRFDEMIQPEEMLREWRYEMGLAASVEFHGYESRPETLLRFADFALANLRVCAVVWDKCALVNAQPSVFDKPALLVPATGEIVLQEILRSGPVRTVYCDEDIKNKERRKAFKTSLARYARELGHERGPDVKHYPSDKSAHIQFADMIAYVLQRHARGLSKTPKLRERAQRLWRKEGNVIRWGGWDDLRPYLTPKA